MTSETRPAADYDGADRRAHPRIPASAVPYLTARLARGPSVRLLDLSKRGVHIESALPMRPGCTVTVRFLTGPQAVTLTAAVVRSTGAALETSGAVTYHTALAFTDELTLCAEEPVPADGPEMTSRLPGAATPAGASDYVMIVTDGRQGAPFRQDRTPT